MCIRRTYDEHAYVRTVIAALRGRALPSSASQFAELLEALRWRIASLWSLDLDLELDPSIGQLTSTLLLRDTANRQIRCGDRCAARQRNLLERYAWR